MAAPASPPFLRVPSPSQRSPLSPSSTYTSTTYTHTPISPITPTPTSSHPPSLFAFPELPNPPPHPHAEQHADIYRNRSRSRNPSTASGPAPHASTSTQLTFVGTSLTSTPLTLKGVDRGEKDDEPGKMHSTYPPPTHNTLPPPTIRLPSPGPSPTMHPLSHRQVLNRRHLSLASTRTVSTDASTISSSSTGSGRGPIAGLANLVERAIARWARHAHASPPSSESSDDSSDRDSVISYPTYRAPAHEERRFELLLPLESVRDGPETGAGTSEGERFIKTTELAEVLGRLENELRGRTRHKKHHHHHHHHHREHGESRGAVGAGSAGGGGLDDAERARRRARRREGKSKLREGGEVVAGGEDTATPLGDIFEQEQEGHPSVDPDTKGKLPDGMSAGMAPSATTSAPESGATTPMTPAALLAADLGMSKPASGTNLNLNLNVHQLNAQLRPHAMPSPRLPHSPAPTQPKPVSTAAAAAAAVEPAAPHLHPTSPSSSWKEERSAWWLDVASPTSSDMRALGKLLHLHPLTLEDVLYQDPREKLELFPRLGYYFVSFSAVPSRDDEDGGGGLAYGNGNGKMAKPDADDVSSLSGSSESDGQRWAEVDLGDLGPAKIEGVQIYMVVFAEGIVTFHFHDFEEHLTRVRERALRLEKMYPILADWIAHGLVDSIVDAYLPIIKRLERETDRITSIVQAFTFYKGKGNKYETSFARPSPTREPFSVSAMVDDRYLRAREFADREKQAGLRFRARRGQQEGRVGAGAEGESPDAGMDMGMEPEKIDSSRAYTHHLGPLKPKRKPFGFLRDTYGLFVRLLPTRKLQRAMSIDTHRGREKPPHPRVVTLYRIASARRMVTSITRLLVHKPVVLHSLRRRFAGIKGVKGDVGVYLDDVEDHVLGMQQALTYCDGTLSQLHPGYLSQLKVAFENAKNGMDKRLLYLSIISITVLTIQVFIGLFSMNVNVPHNDKPGGSYETFGLVFVGSVTLLLCVFALVRFWWVRSRKRFKERRRNR